jgi:N-acetyl sugar amidotransferase
MIDWMRNTPAIPGQIMPGEPGYRVCRRCVMDTTMVEIEFDADGVCNFCRGYDQQVRWSEIPEVEKARKLAATLGEMKRDGEGRPYDCVLGLSGGVDSSYLALKCKDWGVRPLLVQFDNGWNTELANHNIQVICEKLGFDLFTYVVDWPEFRDLQLSFLKAGVANVEAPSDHGIFACIYKTARQHRIRWLLSGVNSATEACCPIGGKSKSHFSYGYRYSDLRHLRALQRRFGTRALKTFPTMGFLERIWLERRYLRRCDPLNLIHFDKKAAIVELEQRIGWRRYEGKHFESVITRFHQSYILPRKFGLDKRRLHVSGLIWSGQISRSDAIREIEQPPCPPDLVEKDRQFFMKKLGLGKADFEALMQAQAKTYRDYPHMNWVFSNFPRFTAALRKVMHPFCDSTPAKNSGDH